jgi:hypothetical protein
MAQDASGINDLLIQRIGSLGPRPSGEQSMLITYSAAASDLLIVVFDSPVSATI